MDTILRWLEENVPDANITISNGIITCWNKYVIFLIAPPHDRESFYLLRIGAHPIFDRWANSTVIEEYFSAADILVDYLETEQLDIYKLLFEAMCDEWQ